MEIDSEQNSCTDRTENATSMADSTAPALPPDASSPTAGKHGVRRGGAPRQNENASRHGLKMTKFPLAAKNDEAKLWEFRRLLRDEVVSLYGDDLGLYRDALIQSACRHESRAILASRWLRVHGETLPLSERLSLLAAVSGATDQRDKCVRLLGLERATASARNPWAVLDAHADESTSATSGNAEGSNG